MDSMRRIRQAIENAHVREADQSSLEFIRAAVACSMDALKKFGEAAHLSDFLAANHTSVRKVILTKSPETYACLQLEIEKLKWGEEAMLFDLTDTATRLDYLQAVSIFGGEVHLVGIELSASEAPLFLQMLCSSPTPPHSLHVRSSFYAASEYDMENRGSEILETVRTNEKITDLTVADAHELDFVDIQAPIPSLQSLTLIGVQVGVKFFEHISAHLDNWASLRSLTFSHVQRTTKHLDRRKASQRWQETFSDLVRNDCHHLKHLALEGFSLNQAENHFLDFIKVLEKNSSLQSLSLAHCAHSGFLNRASVIASLVDAIHKSELLYIDLQGTPFADDPAIEAKLGKNHHLVLKSYDKVPATAVRLFICGDSYAGKTTLLSTLSRVSKERLSFEMDSRCKQCQNQTHTGY